MAFFEPKPDKTMPNVNPAVLGGIVIGILTIYGVLLINPMTSAKFQYPYYQLFCGKKPVIANNGISNSYSTPDSARYSPPSSFDTLYCTELEAMSHGHNRV